MKWKKIGKVLILDKNYKYTNIEELKPLLNIHNVDTIVKIKNISGKFRKPEIEILIGNNTETIHKENSCVFKLDLAKVMWSKGNINERLRIANLVEDNEIVVDMFAGIGYFSIPIAIHSSAFKIFSIEINPDSYMYLNENINLNKINKRVNYERMKAIFGNCMDITPKLSADRVLMGYVKTTHHYLGAAMECVKKGGTIHYHEIVPEKLIDTRPCERIINSADGREIELLNLKVIKKYSPGVVHVVVDAKIY